MRKIIVQEFISLTVLSKHQEDQRKTPQATSSTVVGLRHISMKQMLRQVS
jgi:hypothetical protein